MRFARSAIDCWLMSDILSVLSTDNLLLARPAHTRLMERGRASRATMQKRERAHPSIVTEQSSDKVALAGLLAKPELAGKGGHLGHFQLKSGRL